MKLVIALFIALVLSLGGPSAWAKDGGDGSGYAKPRVTNKVFTACPKQGWDAMAAVDKANSMGPVAAHVSILCLTEAIKTLEARVKVLEAVQAKSGP